MHGINTEYIAIKLQKLTWQDGLQNLFQKKTLREKEILARLERFLFCLILSSTNHASLYLSLLCFLDRFFFSFLFSGLDDLQR